MPRPPRYATEIAQRLLHELRAGRGLRAICAGAGMPSARTVHKWINDDIQGFAAAYADARQAAALGRGPAHSAEIAARILREVSAGRPLIDICRDPGMPCYGTVRSWVTEDRHGFAAPYRAALRAGGARWARPVRYDAGIAEYVLGELCVGRTLDQVCSEPAMPTAAAVRGWVKQDRGGFAARYDEARRVGCYILADDYLWIADSRDFWIERQTASGEIEFILDPHRTRRLKQRLAAPSWLLTRLAPRIFG